MKVNGREIDPRAQLLDIDRADCEESLYEFVRCAWGVIDPSPWRDSWAIDAVCTHLQAVVDGQIKRLIINIPPRSGKSTVTAVCLPAWVWAQSRISPTSGPGVPFLFASYATQLSLRDSVKCRRLLESKWYLDRWGSRFVLNTDQNTKSRFGNDKGGERLIASVGAAVTGEGANLFIWDDLNAAGEAFSETTIQTTNDWIDHVASTRLNDPKTGAVVLIQQRLAEDDATGHVLEKEAGDWVHVMIPMRYEPERSFVTMIGWKDPRSEAGELMWPERFGETEVKRLEKSLGKWASAGQLQQRPEPAGGGVIKREWWKVWEEANFPPMDFILGSVDTAYTEKTQNDYSAMTVWGVFRDDQRAQASRIIDESGRPMYLDRIYSDAGVKLMLMYAWQDRLEFHELVQKVAATAVKMKCDMCLVEAKAAGHSVAQELRRLYANEKFGVQLYDPKTLDKLARLYSVQHLFEEGMVFAPDRVWAEMVITQVGQFPAGAHDDLCDTVSQAVRHLRDMGLLARGIEEREAMEGLKTYPRGAEAPLYPV